MWRVTLDTALLARRALLGLVFLAAWTSQVCQAQEPLRLGGLFALTGSGADWGIAEDRGVQLALEEARARGVAVEYFREDGPAEEVNKSVTAFRFLVNVRKVQVVIGPTWDDVAAAVAPIADETGVVVIAPDASGGIEATRDYPNFFAIFTPEPAEMSVLAAYLKNRGIKTVAIVHNQDPFSTQWNGAFVAEAKAAGLTIVAEMPISDPEVKDFRTQITRLRDLKPDAVFVEFTSQDTKGPFMRQAKELRLQSLIVSSSTSQTDSTLASFGPFIEGLVYAFPKENDKHRQFNERYRRQFGEAPGAPAAAYAYDAAAIAIRAYEQGARSGADFRKALLALRDYDGASSSGISFDPKGRVVWPQNSFIMKTARNGAWEELR